MQGRSKKNDKQEESPQKHSRRPISKVIINFKILHLLVMGVPKIKYALYKHNMSPNQIQNKLILLITINDLNFKFYYF